VEKIASLGFARDDKGRVSRALGCSHP